MLLVEELSWPRQDSLFVQLACLLLLLVLPIQACEQLQLSGMSVQAWRLQNGYCLLPASRLQDMHRLRYADTTSSSQQ